MSCDRIDLGGGNFAIVCSRGKRTPRCSVPGCSSPGAFQCDYPVKGRKSGTCDAYLCTAHRRPQALDPDLFAELFAEPRESRDYCPPHDAVANRRTVACR